MNKQILFSNLTDVFKQNSLKNMTTLGNNPMPHKGNEFYIWNELKDDEEISKIIERGNFWKPGSGKTVNSYISLSDFAYSEKYYCIELGPNSNSSSNTVRLINLGDKIRIIANGWGSSFVILWEGEREELLTYLKEFQKRD
jgi:hypothetical protein